MPLHALYGSSCISGCTQPKIIRRRLEKEDLDGLFERHTFCRASRLERYFDDLADRDDKQRLEMLLKNVFRNHHDGIEV
mgnify:FL=1